MINIVILHPLRMSCLEYYTNASPVLKRFSPIYLHLALDLRWKNLTTRQIFTLSDGLSLQIMATIHKQALKLFSCCEL